MGFLLPLFPMLVDDLLQVVDIVNGDALDLAHLGVHVPRHGNVKEKKRTPFALFHRAARFLRMHDVMRRAGRSHDDADVRSLFQRHVKIHGFSPVFRGQLLRLFPVVIRDIYLLHAAAQKIFHGQLRHAPRAVNQLAGLGQVAAENFPRQLHRRIADRHRAERDARLSPHPLARSNRPMKQRIQHRRGRPGVVRHRIGVLHLGEYLPFADDQRIKARRHAEQMPDGVLMHEAIQVRLHILIDAGQVRPKVLQCFRAALGVVRHRVNLATVAGGKHHRLMHGLIAGQRNQSAAHPFFRYGKALANFHGRRFMIQSNCDQLHF